MEHILEVCVCGSSRSRNSKYKRKLKQKLYKKSRGICGICGQGVGFNQATLDHKVPLSKGGTWSLKNLQVAHRKCNEHKGDSYD
ncbi:MAG: HNH endonuclease [Candidatus Heimdallarchaeaceae archaeon]